MTGRGLSLALTLAALAAAPAGADNAGVERTFLERAAISAADRSCNLFTDAERLALKSGLYQTEGELLRSGREPNEIAELTEKVSAHAKSLGCDHPSVREVAATIRSSYRQFAKTNWLEYPAAHSAWGASRSEHDKWAASQADKTSGAIFGLRRNEGKDALRLAVAIPNKARAPATVQLFTRDPNRLGEPWLGSIMGSATGALAAPPRSIARADWAGELAIEEDASGNEYQVFYFAPSAITRLEALDPREAVQIELTPPQRAKDQKPQRIVFEVGDIRAAHAFVMIPAPTYTTPPADKTAAKPAH